MKRPQFRTWITQFPISLAVEGPDCYKRIADLGIETAVFCTTIYSPYRLLLPRYPQKGIYSLEEGMYWYQAEAKRYKGLPWTPEPSRDFAGRDLLAEFIEGARKAGLRTAAWVTMFANGRIAKNHPDWAVKNLYGSDDRLFLDFNHPQVIDYSLRIIDEVAQRYDLDEILLDKFPQTCLELNVFGGRVDPVMRIMGSLCFSDHAIAAAKKAGIDLAACREKALKLAAESLAIPPHVVNSQLAELQGDTEAPLLMLDHPWLLDVLRWRIDCIKDFLVQARRRIDARRKGVELTMAFVPPVKIGHDSSSPRSWLAAQSYAAYADSAADRIHCVVHWDEDVVEYDTTRAVNAVKGGNVKICTHIKAYGATRPDQLPGLAAAAKRGGADGVGFFCYDLMTDDMLAAAGTSLKALRK